MYEVNEAMATGPWGVRRFYLPLAGFGFGERCLAALIYPVQRLAICYQPATFADHPQLPIRLLVHNRFLIRHQEPPLSQFRKNTNENRCSSTGNRTPSTCVNRGIASFLTPNQYRNNFSWFADISAGRTRVTAPPARMRPLAKNTRAGDGAHSAFPLQGGI